MAALAGLSGLLRMHGGIDSLCVLCVQLQADCRTPGSWQPTAA
jgi:hypothetical protein